LAIAQRLGYISVIEELKLVTQTTLVSTTIKTTEEKYKVQTPETMQETFMSDSEDELGKLKSRKKKLQEIKIKNT
jgi:ankyrin